MSYGYRGKHSRQTNRGKVLLTASILAVLLLSAAAFVLLRPKEPAPENGSQTGELSQQANGSASVPAGSGSEPAGQPDVSRVPPDMSVPEETGYDFSQPAPKSEAVDNSYFSDAAFVGDSRTDGFMLYSGIGTGKNLTSNGLSMFSLASKKALTIDGKKYTLLEALALGEYKKVYISLGVNELGIFRDDDFYESYCDAVDQIRMIQPDAVIYIQGLIPLNEGKIEEYNGNKYNLHNDHLLVYNDLMRRVAEEKQVVYLDLYSEFVDENGELPRDASRDGVHLVKESCQRWLAYLKTHTVDFDVLYPDGPPSVENIEPEQTPEDGSGQA